MFDEHADRLGRVDFLVQGTTYPDVIESVSKEKSASAVIKTHHNVGGLPEDMRLELVEPLRFLFKDEVREVGSALGLPDDIVWRQPFPGPGLAIRILGEVTTDKLRTLREADHIVTDEVQRADLSRDLWQAFAVLGEGRTVGVMGDDRDLRVHHRRQGRDQPGRHDGGLGEAPLRPARPDLQPHRQRGAGR